MILRCGRLRLPKHSGMFQPLRMFDFFDWHQLSLHLTKSIDNSAARQQQQQHNSTATSSTSTQQPTAHNPPAPAAQQHRRRRVDVQQQQLILFSNESENNQAILPMSARPRLRFVRLSRADNTELMISLLALAP